MQLPISDDPKAVALAFIARWPWKFRPDFGDWIESNWHIWRAFKREADTIWDSGRRHWSARTIGEYLRHQSALQSVNDGEWKINNNRFPCMARLYLCFHPERDGFFELRTGEARAA